MKVRALYDIPPDIQKGDVLEVTDVSVRLEGKSHYGFINLGQWEVYDEPVNMAVESVNRPEPVSELEEPRQPSLKDLVGQDMKHLQIEFK